MSTVSYCTHIITIPTTHIKITENRIILTLHRNEVDSVLH